MKTTQSYELRKLKRAMNNGVTGEEYLGKEKNDTRETTIVCVP
jgi:hypothetical protein